VRDYIYEGGDVLNLGDGRVLVATGPSSTNERGAKWVKKMLEHDGYRVEIIELPEVGIHHLFAVICVAGPKLVIAYEDSFPNGLPEFMGDFDVIWANREEALATGPCASMLDEKHILMPEETPRLNEELIKRGVTPVTVPFKHHALMCGGIRCKTSVIRREIV
jgi:N-dimethylarginine dimethylaminohydrolase